MLKRGRCAICEQTISVRMLMCRKHWALVPREMRDEVILSRRQRRRTDYINAVRAAIKYVRAHEQEGPGGQMSLL